MRKGFYSALVFGLLLAFVAGPAQAAKPMPSVTSVDVTSVPDGSGGCTWTFNTSVEDFVGPQREIRIGVQTDSTWNDPVVIPVTGRFTSLTQTIETEWNTLNGYFVELWSKDSMVSRWAVGDLNRVCGCDLVPFADLRACDFTQVAVSGVDIHGANMSGAGMYYLDLTDANLSDVNLNGATLVGLKMTGVDLAGADLRNVWGSENHNFYGSNLSGVNLDGSYWTLTDLGNHDWRTATMTNMKFYDAGASGNFDGVDFHGLVLDEGGLRGSFVGANLDGIIAYGRGAPGRSSLFGDFANAMFVGADLRATTFYS